MSEETSPSTSMDSDPTFALSPPKILTADEKDKEISQLKNVIYYDSIEKEKLEKKIKKLKKNLKKVEESKKEAEEKMKQQEKELSAVAASQNSAPSSTVPANGSDKKESAVADPQTQQNQQQQQIDLKGLLKQFKMEKEVEKTKVTLLRSQIEQESKEKFLIDKFILLYYNTEDAEELEDKEHGYAKNLKPLFFAFQKWQHQPYFLQNVITAIRFAGLRKPFHFRISLFWIKFVSNFIQILTISHEPSVKNALQKISSLDNMSVQGNAKNIPSCSFPFLMSRFSEANVLNNNDNANTTTGKDSKDSKEAEPAKPVPVSSFSLVNNFIQNLTGVFSELYTSFLCTLFIKLEKILKKEKDREEKHEVFRYFESLYSNLLAWKVESRFIVHIFTSCIEYIDHLLVYQMASAMSRQNFAMSSAATAQHSNTSPTKGSNSNSANSSNSSGTVSINSPATHPDTIIFTKSVLAFFFSFLKNFWAKMKNDLKLPHTQNIPTFFCYSHQACDSWLSYLSLVKQVPIPEVMKVCRAMCKNYSNAQFKSLFSFVKDPNETAAGTTIIPMTIIPPAITIMEEKEKEKEEKKEEEKKTDKKNAHPAPKLANSNSKSNLLSKAATETKIDPKVEAKLNEEKAKANLAAAASIPPPPPPPPIFDDRSNQHQELKTFSISLTMTDTTVEGEDAFPHLLTGSRQTIDKLCKQINIKSNPQEFSMSETEKVFLAELDFLFF